MNKRKVPKIRFKGFYDDWEQRKLGELFNFHYGDGNNNPSNGGKYPVFGAGGIQGGYTKYNAENSVIIGHMGDAGCVSWGEGKHFVTYNGTITKPKDEVFSAKFGYYLLLNMNLRKYRGGSGLPFLTYDMLTEMETKCTNSKIETQKIADYFTNLDRLITLHQRKLEKLKIIKKSMLENCFPKNGEKAPKNRFSGFSDDWEQRKLADIVDRITRKNESLESTLPLTISAQYGLIDQNEFFDKRIASKDVSGYYLVRRGEFAYNKSTSSDAPWGAIKRLDRYECGVLSTLYIVFRILDEDKVNSDYLVTYYDTDLWHKGVQAIAAEGARNHGLLNIAPADFFETTVSVPKDIEEQRKIGAYIMQLDHLITLHQSKLEKLKMIKKSMLETMFV